MKVKKQRRWMVIKYGFVYTCVVGAFSALIVLRAYSLLYQLSTTDSLAAIFFRDMIKFTCSLCAQI